MLQDLSEQVRACLAHAEDCARRASSETDPTLRRDLLDMERRWWRLAESMQLVDRLTAFIRQSRKPPPHDYRLYVLGSDGKTIGPGVPIWADNDLSAITGAKVHINVNGGQAMLRDGTRTVKAFERKA